MSAPAAPGEAALEAALAATWPPRAEERIGPVTLRPGAEGGRRATAATAERALSPEELDAAIARMAALGQRPSFRLRPAEAALDAALAARGWQIEAPTDWLAAPVAALSPLSPEDPADAIPCEMRLAVMTPLWHRLGTAPDRLAVMDRVKGPARILLGRYRERPAALGFVAIACEIAFVHALGVLPEARRAGLGRKMVGRAADWAQSMGAVWLIALCERGNLPAQALFSGVGMQNVGQYHYRVAPPPAA